MSELGHTTLISVYKTPTPFLFFALLALVLPRFVYTEVNKIGERKMYKTLMTSSGQINNKANLETKLTVDYQFDIAACTLSNARSSRKKSSFLSGPDTKAFSPPPLLVAWPLRKELFLRLP